MPGSAKCHSSGFSNTGASNATIAPELSDAPHEKASAEVPFGHQAERMMLPLAAQTGITRPSATQTG